MVKKIRISCFRQDWERASMISAAAIRGRVGVQQLKADRNLPPVAKSNYMQPRMASASTCIAALQIGIADIHAEAYPAGNAVDCARKYLADSNGCDCINRSARACGISIARIIPPPRTEHRGGRHQNSAGVAARAFDQNAQTRGAAIFVTMPSGMRSRSSSGPCSICSSTNAL
jgi:hypothetical protein